MEPLKKARIGFALAMSGVPLTFLWGHLAGNLFQVWYRSHQISALVLAALAVAPSVILAVIGLVGYGIGRKDFWRVYSGRKTLLAVLGLALMFLGGFFIAYTWSISAYEAGRSTQPLAYYLASNSPYFVLFVLWFNTGLMVFADSLEAHWRKK